MIPWEVSMKFEQFKHMFQILQIMKKHYADGYHKSTAITMVCQNLKIWNPSLKNVQNSLKLPKLIIKYLNLCIGGVFSFEFQKVCIWKVRFKFWQITALAGAYDNRQRNSHHWRSLKSPACVKVHHWRLSNVARQWCFPLYIWVALSKFSKSQRVSARNETTPSRCQNFPPNAAVLPDRRRPSDHPAVLQECPADLHERLVIVREGPTPSPRGLPPSSSRAPPLLLWTAAAPSSAGAPPTVDLLPERRRPLFPTRMTSSSPRAASPTAG
jgi:hypothetical protein